MQPQYIVDIDAIPFARVPISVTDIDIRLGEFGLTTHGTLMRWKATCGRVFDR